MLWYRQIKLKENLENDKTCKNGEALKLLRLCTKHNLSSFFLVFICCLPPRYLFIFIHKKHLFSNTILYFVECYLSHDSRIQGPTPMARKGLSNRYWQVLHRTQLKVLSLQITVNILGCGDSSQTSKTLLGAYPLLKSTESKKNCVAKHNGYWFQSERLQWALASAKEHCFSGRPSDAFFPTNQLEIKACGEQASYTWCTFHSWWDGNVFAATTTDIEIIKKHY